MQKYQIAEFLTSLAYHSCILFVWAVSYTPAFEAAFRQWALRAFTVHVIQPDWTRTYKKQNNKKTNRIWIKNIRTLFFIRV